MSQASTAASVTGWMAGTGIGSQDEAPMTESQQEEAKRAIEEQELYVPFDEGKPPPAAAPSAAAAQKKADDATGVGGSHPDASPFDEEESEEGTQMGDDATSDAVAAVIAAAAAAGWKVNKTGAKFFVENEAALNEKGYGSITDCAEDFAEDDTVKRTKKIFKYHLERLLAAEEQTTMVESQDPFGEVEEEEESDEAASEDETDLMKNSSLVLSRMKADAQTELDQLQAPPHSCIASSSTSSSTGIVAPLQVQARSDPIKLAMNEFVSKYKGLEKGDAVRAQASEVYNSVKEFSRSPEFDQMSRMEHELRIAVHTAALEADEYPGKHSALVSRVSELESAMKAKAVEEVMEKAAKAEQKRKSSVAGPSSAKKHKGGKGKA